MKEIDAQKRNKARHLKNSPPAGRPSATYDTDTVQPGLSPHFDKSVPLLSPSMFLYFLWFIIFHSSRVGSRLELGLLLYLQIITMKSRTVG
jgi:hypothetical protein